MTALVNLPLLLASSSDDKGGRGGVEQERGWKRGQQKVRKRRGRGEGEQGRDGDKEGE